MDRPITYKLESYSFIGCNFKSALELKKNTVAFEERYCWKMKDKLKNS